MSMGVGARAATRRTVGEKPWHVGLRAPACSSAAGACASACRRLTAAKVHDHRSGPNRSECPGERAAAWPPFTGPRLRPARRKLISQAHPHRLPGKLVRRGLARSACAATLIADGSRYPRQRVNARKAARQISRPRILVPSAGDYVSAVPWLAGALDALSRGLARVEDAAAWTPAPRRRLHRRSHRRGAEHVVAVDVGAVGWPGRCAPATSAHWTVPTSARTGSGRRPLPQAGRGQAPSLISLTLVLRRNRAAPAADDADLCS